MFSLHFFPYKKKKQKKTNVTHIITVLRKNLLDEKIGISWHNLVHENREREVRNLITALDDLMVIKDELPEGIVKLDQELKNFLEKLLEVYQSDENISMLSHYQTHDVDMKIKTLIQWLESYLTEHWFTIKEIVNPKDPDLKEFYHGIYERLFPLEDEREPLKNIKYYIGVQKAATITIKNLIQNKGRDAALQDKSIKGSLIYNPFNDVVLGDYHIVIAKSHGIIIGGAMFSTVITKCTAACCYDFIFVDNSILASSDDPYIKKHTTGSDKIQISKQLFSEVIEISRNDARELGNRELDCVLGEINDPFKMYETIGKEGLLADSVNPFSRLRLELSSAGFKVLNYKYSQPPLEEGALPCKYLFHIMLPFNTSWKVKGVPPDEMKSLILSYFSSWEDLSLEKDPTVKEIIEDLDRIKSEGKNVPLLGWKELMDHYQELYGYQIDSKDGEADSSKTFFQHVMDMVNNHYSKRK